MKIKPLFKIILKNQKLFLAILLFLVLIIPLITNLAKDKPLLMGEESYYHLSQEKIHYFPLHFLDKILPLEGLAFLPIVLAFAAQFLFFKLAERISLDEKFTFFFLLFLILSPAFIFTFITLSTYSLFVFLVVLGFLLLTEEKTKYYSLIPFTFTTLLDIYCAILLTGLLAVFYFRKKSKPLLLAIGLIILFALGSKLIFSVPFISGPFYLEQIIPDLISDLGGKSGISFFTLLLSLIGVIYTWKKKKHHFAYILLPLTLFGYIYRTNTIFLLALLVAFFAATGLVKLLERDWTLPSLKKITIFILLLGILFSTITYLDRVTLNGPSAGDQESLTWVKENLPRDESFFSLPEYSYYISYFSQKEPFYYFHDTKNPRKEISPNIFNATYIHDVFPLLDENEVTLIYITPPMREQLPAEQGFLFLLKNERFKLPYTENNFEVWRYKRENDR